MQHVGSTLKAVFPALVLVGVIACGDSGSTFVPSVPSSPGPSPDPTGSPFPPLPPPGSNLDPEITFFELPTPEIERGAPLLIPEGSLVTTTPRGLQGPEAAFRVEIRALSEGIAFEQLGFFTAVQAGCATGDEICVVQELAIDIGPDAELDDYSIEVTVFDSINASDSEIRNFTIVDSPNSL